jgi:hypothetical protein
MRHAIVVVPIAHLITGVHRVWRHLGEPVGRQPAYARSRKLPVLILAVLTWLPAKLAQRKGTAKKHGV